MLLMKDKVNEFIQPDAANSNEILTCRHGEVLISIMQDGNGSTALSHVDTIMHEASLIAKLKLVYQDDKGALKDDSCIALKGFLCVHLHRHLSTR